VLRVSTRVVVIADGTEVDLAIMVARRCEPRESGMIDGGGPASESDGAEAMAVRQ
jgi:hypothetical protein